MKRIRIKITDGFGNISFLVVDKRNVRYMSRGMIPLALSNISDNASELTFLLENCKTPTEAVRICQSKMKYAKTVELA